MVKNYTKKNKGNKRKTTKPQNEINIKFFNHYIPEKIIDILEEKNDYSFIICFRINILDKTKNIKINDLTNIDKGYLEWLLGNFQKDLNILSVFQETKNFALSRLKKWNDFYKKENINKDLEKSILQIRPKKIFRNNIFTNLNDHKNENLTEFWGKNQFPDDFNIDYNKKSEPYNFKGIIYFINL